MSIYTTVWICSFCSTWIDIANIVGLLGCQYWGNSRVESDLGTALFSFPCGKKPWCKACVDLVLVLPFVPTCKIIRAVGPADPICGRVEGVLIPQRLRKSQAVASVRCCRAIHLTVYKSPPARVKIRPAIGYVTGDGVPAWPSLDRISFVVFITSYSIVVLKGTTRHMIT